MLAEHCISKDICKWSQHTKPKSANLVWSSYPINLYQKKKQNKQKTKTNEKTQPFQILTENYLLDSNTFTYKKIFASFSLMCTRTHSIF